MPRRSGMSRSAVAARTAYCQVWLRARASGIAEPRLAPMAAGPAPSRNPRARVSVRAAGSEQDEAERGRESCPRRAIAKSADFERDPAKGEQGAAAGLSSATSQRERCDPAAGAAGRAGVPGGELDQATAEQDQHEPWADRRGRNSARDEIADPAWRVRAAGPTGADQADSREGRDRGDRAAHESVPPPTPGAIDRQLGRCPGRGAGCSWRWRLRTRWRRSSRAGRRHSSRKSLMCIGGPPKPRQPIGPHSPSE